MDANLPLVLEILLHLNACAPLADCETAQNPQWECAHCPADSPCTCRRTHTAQYHRKGYAACKSTTEAVRQEKQKDAVTSFSEKL